MASNVVVDKSKLFAIRIIRLYQHLCKNKKEFILSTQILRSGTSIGANIREAHQGQSKKDFVSKMNIALKESVETEYWLELLYETNYISKIAYESIYYDCTEISKLLISIIKSCKQNQ